MPVTELQILVAVELGYEGLHESLKGIDPSDTGAYTWVLEKLYNHERTSEDGQWVEFSDDYHEDDPTPLQGCCLEVPSPTLDFYPNSEWIEGIKDHWKLLLKFGIAHINHNCATHVHIWPKGKKDWSLDQLKQIAKAVIYFEKAFEVISAPSRRNHDHTRHNKASNPELKDLEFAECCERIRKCTNNLELISTMQPGDSKAKAPTYAWNFMNTDRCFDEDIDDPEDEPVGTIVPPRLCVKTAGHCLIWVQLVVSFVQAAAQYDPEASLEKYEPNVAGLLMFICKSGSPDENGKDLLDIVFHGHLDNEQGVDTDSEMEKVFDERLKELRRLKPQSSLWA